MTLTITIAARIPKRFKGSLGAAIGSLPLARGRG